MSQMLSFLQNWGAYAIMGIAAITWKHWVPKLLDYALDKKIIKYKTDLETEKEKQLAEYGKGITGFNKFFDKKYEIYPSLYSRVIRLHGDLSYWAGDHKWPDFNSISNEDFDIFLKDFDLPHPYRIALKKKRETGKVSDCDIDMLIPVHCSKLIKETKNDFLLNRLFVSREVESLVESFFKNIESANKENDQVVLDIFNQMRTELEHGN